jgi:hypothetical protein
LTGSTPGHTPGHQSLLVKLPKTGTVLLTGDAVHFKDNWDNRRVPGVNTDKDQTIASTQRRFPGQGTGEALDQSRQNPDRPTDEVAGILR